MSLFSLSVTNVTHLHSFRMSAVTNIRSITPFFSWSTNLAFHPPSCTVKTLQSFLWSNSAICLTIVLRPGPSLVFTALCLINPRFCLQLSSVKDRCVHIHDLKSFNKIYKLRWKIRYLYQNKCFHLLALVLYFVLIMTVFPHNEAIIKLMANQA